MSETEIAHHEEALRRLCRERGIPFTRQRRVVLRAVLELGSHPTADEVFDAAIVRRAGVSRATVYRTLESFAQLGVIDKVGHPGNAVRYDGRLRLHHHFFCLRCNAITDIAGAHLDAVTVSDARELGLLIQDCRVQLSGLCSHCLTKQTHS